MLKNALDKAAGMRSLCMKYKDASNDVKGAIDDWFKSLGTSFVNLGFINLVATSSGSKSV